MIQPVPLTAKFEDPGYIVWCGTMLRDEQGKCHLFYSRWPRALGHYAWVTHSEVAHAVADHPLGPYKFVSVALPERGKDKWDGLCTHNPTVMKFGSKYYLYYMGNTGDRKKAKDLNWTHRNNQRIGVAVADSPNGPWTRSDKPLIPTTPGFHDGLCNNNPTVTRRPEGDYLMVYKGIGDKGKTPFGGPVVHVVATSDSPTGPFKKHPNPVFTKPGIPSQRKTPTSGAARTATGPSSRTSKAASPARAPRSPSSNPPMASTGSRPPTHSFPPSTWLGRMDKHETA